MEKSPNCSWSHPNAWTYEKTRSLMKSSFFCPKIHEIWPVKSCSYPMTGMTGLFHSYPTWPPIWSPVEPEPCDATRRVDPSAEFSAVSNARNVVAMFISNWWYTYPSETIKQCHKPSSSPFLWVVSINHSQSWMVYDIALTTLIIIVITIN